jgi:hypothetical protein
VRCSPRTACARTTRSVWCACSLLRAHLALDRPAGVALLSAPFALGLDGLGLAYLLALGLGVFVAVAVTDTGVEQAA